MLLEGRAVPAAANPRTFVTHLPPLLIDLAIILGAAALSTIVFSRLRQPVVLGYLVAGFAAGPHFSLWPTVVDQEGVGLWSEIGVIFLLFCLGLEFSVKKLAHVGKSAFVAAFFELVAMSAVGYACGRLLGWTVMDSVYLGAILSMSSTTIIIRAFEEAGLKRRGFAALVFGILIVEDLMAILLMVVLSALGKPGELSAAKLAGMTARLTFSLLAWFLVGTFLLPTFLRKARAFSDEIMLLVASSLCFLMVVIATNAGFSAALGAFLMGSILAETEEGERIERIMIPVRDLFAAVFFVSVGMMIDPAVLRQHYGVVLLITALTVIGKLVGSGFGALLSGRGLRESVQAGMSLAQIGEFSFILANLGVSLGVVSGFLYPVVIAVSAVTTFTTPYLIRFSDPISNALEKHLPRGALERLGRRERDGKGAGRDGAIRAWVRGYGPLLVLNAAAAWAAGRVVELLLPALGLGAAGRIAGGCVALLAALPFLHGMAWRESGLAENAGRRRWGSVALRAALGWAAATAVFSRSSGVALPPALGPAALALAAAASAPSGRLYRRIEAHFLRNLSARERDGKESSGTGRRAG
jgi:CPA2 family monovalent cation:H+ antiporter-2